MRGGGARCRRGHAFASLEFPKLANAQPSNFGPLPYFITITRLSFQVDICDCNQKTNGNCFVKSFLFSFSWLFTAMNPLLLISLGLALLAIGRGDTEKEANGSGPT